MRYRHALTAVLAALATACGGSERNTPAPDDSTPLTVETAAATMRDRTDVFEAAGVVRGRTSATLSSRILAPVRAVLVQPGDRVHAGQTLVVLDDSELAATARQMKAQRLAADQALAAAHAERDAVEAAVVLARASHARVAALYDRKSATAQELDEARSALDAAEARLARAKAGVDEVLAAVEGARAGAEGADAVASFARITAPFDGLVTEKLVDPGNLVAPATPLLRLEDTRAFEFEVRVDESRAAWVGLDASVPVVVGAGDAPLEIEGRITEIARAVEAGTRTFLVTITLTATDGLRPGTFARARLPGVTRRVLTVPDAAIVRHGQLTSVFVAEHDTARMRAVSVGRAEAGWTDVLAGLSDGEAVVVAPAPALRDGASLAARASSATGGPS